MKTKLLLLYIAGLLAVCPMGGNLMAQTATQPDVLKNDTVSHKLIHRLGLDAVSYTHLIPTMPPQVRVPITLPILFALKLQGNKSPSEAEYLLISNTFGPTSVASGIVPTLSLIHILLQNTMPMPKPNNPAPTTQAMNSCPGPNNCGKLPSGPFNIA